MSLLALGCNPEIHGSDIDVLKGVPLGALAYSPDGGLYMAIRNRNGSVTGKGTLCHLQYSMVLIPTANNAAIGVSIVIPQTQLAANDYGWALIFGRGEVQVDNGNTTAANSYAAAVGNAAGQAEHASTTDAISGLFLATSSGSAGRLVECFATFPKKVS